MFRSTLAFLLLSARLFAQRDTTIDGVKLHLLFSEHSDTIATAWIANVTTNTGAYYELFPNGKINTKGNKSNGKEAGTWETYYPDGKLRSHGMYQNGLKTGAWKFYYDNGKKYAEGFYSKGQKDGLWREWYENDTLSFRGQYWHDYCTGTWKWYYDNGKLKAWARYRAKSKLAKKKIPHGSDQFFEPKGYYPWWKKRYTFFNVDSLVEYYPNGQLRSRIYYDKSGNRLGRSSFWYANGNLNRVEIYNELHPDSCWNYYCEDGRVHHMVAQNTSISCAMEPDTNADCIYPGDIVPLIQFDTKWFPDIRAKF